MYAGHIAIGVALKARYPQVPALPIMLGVGVLDILNGLFIMTGIDRITANPEAGPFLFFDLDFVDWDHSLLMAAVISILWGLLFIRHRQTALVAAAAVFLHWLSDWPVHNSDLALYPHSAMHFGGDLWAAWGIYAWLLEGALVALLALWAWRGLKAAGCQPLWPSLLLLALFLNSSPWLSPMRFIATLEEPTAHLLAGAVIMISFVIPGLLLSWLLRGQAAISASRS